MKQELVFANEHFPAGMRPPPLDVNQVLVPHNWSNFIQAAERYLK